MSLSVCMLTAEPPGRVAEALDSVRAVADEIVLAADARVPASHLDAYARLADRLVTIEFRWYERHMAWLHAQCSGDWVLRLDGDEVVSEALAARLPELVRSTSLRQYWIRHAWLFPDVAHTLEDAPWGEDFHNRLLRNPETQRFPGTLHDHAEPAWPAEWVDEPVYHLDLVVNDLEGRRDKAIRYEVATPLRRAAGGGRLNEAFYLPELRASGRTLAPVPAGDRERLRRAVEARDPALPRRRRAAARTEATLAETDRLWEGRAVPGTAYRAAIEPVRPLGSMVPGEGRRAMVRVTNRGTERWPYDLEHRPSIRLSYRWLLEDGSVHVADGVRTPFPCVVEPGDTVLAPVMVGAPAKPGRYVLSIDVVHDGVTWFEQPHRQPVLVVPHTDLPPAGERLIEEREPIRRTAGAAIPKVVHRIWLGDAPMPAAHARYGETFARHHPGWEHRVWTDDDLPSLGIGAGEQARARTHSELSNLVRYEILHRYGGVYVDTDVECRRPFDELIDGVEAFAGLELPGRVGTAVLGAVPGHPLFARAVRLARQTLGTGPHSANANGPYLVSLLIEQHRDRVTVFGADRFYPYRWDEPERATESFDDAHAVHHWAMSWWTGEKA